ncbi:MAG: response regulator transcription factor [Tissierellia bacterium]|nr:response regulator transcription factor [Tissierellia bacterium]
MIKVLIAEDFRLLREDLADTLEEYENIDVVGVASSGSEAVELARKQNPDVILMDIDMETPTAGIDAAKLIIDELPKTQVIYLTAYEADDIIIDSMGVGAVNYLVKDVDEEKLVQKIEDAYNNQNVLEPEINRTLMNEYARLRYSEQSLLFFINNVGKLTPAEFEIVKMVLEGKTNKEIAKSRFVEPVTIKSQVRSILNKFGCSRKHEMVEMIKNLKLEYLFFESRRI